MINNDSAKQGLLDFMEGKTFSYEQWEGKTFARLKFASSTEKGNIGEDFFKLALIDCGYEDVDIADGRRGDYNVGVTVGNRHIKFGVALATQDIHGQFQFNNIKQDLDYDCVFCLAIFPETIKFLIFATSWLNEREDYRTVSMNPGSDLLKLTRTPEQLIDFDRFEETINQVLRDGWD